VSNIESHIDGPRPNVTDLDEWYAVIDDQDFWRQWDDERKKFVPFSGGTRFTLREARRRVLVDRVRGGVVACSTKPWGINPRPPGWYFYGHWIRIVSM
jgi:hypothetical protein